jgi:hypothetical protein
VIEDAASSVRGSAEPVDLQAFELSVRLPDGAQLVPVMCQVRPGKGEVLDVVHQLQQSLGSLPSHGPGGHS